MHRRQFLYAGLLSCFGADLSNSAICDDKRRRVCGTTSTLFKYSDGPPKWDKLHLTYYIKKRDTSDMSKDEWDNSWLMAFNSWSDVSPLTFSRSTSQRTSDILVDVSDEEDEGFGERGGVLAWAFLPETPTWNGRLVTKFDKSEDWVSSIEDSRSEVLLQAVAAHEIGHLLGLDHSFYDCALMYPYYFPHAPIVIPQSLDDIVRIQDLYLGQSSP